MSVSPRLQVLLLVAGFFFSGSADSLGAEPRGRWSEDQADAWHRETGWLVGSNFAPAYAINQLEMWQADTFDLAAIDRELGWAESLGFNSMRVFLHHLLWEQDSAGFLNRMDKFLAVAEKHKIGIMFVLFDSVWDPNPKLGKQRAPQAGLHNSGWVQSPGAKDLLDPQRYDLLEAYVKGVVGRFKDDRRVHVWDLWNEPDNMNDSSYGVGKLKQEPEAERKHAATLELLRKSFVWAREMLPSQPLTSGPWIFGRVVIDAHLIPIERVQFEESDVITFHSYGKLSEVKEWVTALKKHRRPILCTEYMARPTGSTFDPVLKYLKEEGIGAYNWGFVAGKSNTIYPWDSWQKAYDKEPPVWFHDIFRTDGTPYRPEEVESIRRITGRTK